MSIKKIAVLSFLAASLMLISCEKEYVCVCKKTDSGEKVYGDKVKTTHLGKKGFEKACKANTNDKEECYVE